MRENPGVPHIPNPSRDCQMLRENVVRRRNRLRHHWQVVCLHWWGMLQLASARLRAHFFSPSQGASAKRVAGQRDITGAGAYCRQYREENN